MTQPQCVADCLKRAALLQESDSARLDVELILAFSLKKDRSFLFTWPEYPLSLDELATFEQLFQRRLRGEPVAYLLGEQGFWSLTLKVNTSTLIPRPDTELLVETALEFAFDEARMLDLGTGTGAIALALASEFPCAHIEAVDRMDDALALAKHNAHLNKLERVNVYKSSWFEQVGGHFDLILSNPPYIDCDDVHLRQGDVRFEPHSALISGEQGLEDLRQIITQAGAFLFEGGWLLLEHGWQQADSVRQLLLKCGFDQVQSRRDLAGHERISLGQWPK
ncbi:peptide chain release factor N(5)-glutamine methyltransferase [Agaribacterium haliotis]|uniref:peptide chain release factor N(5)-glutamine methyltransferase n=1 Tax=Agaribacterium haliotis TaxID=2013869 RepID=UPI000BB56F8D|nr:peptide chain release factor N(5)-glutamine methyltransferase [Agaribacterium haliotis]